LIEERVDDTAFAQYMWSGAGYVDEMIVRYRDTDGNGSLEERLWVLQDVNYNVTDLVTNSGTVLERYCYDHHGTATLNDANWKTKTGPRSHFFFDLTWKQSASSLFPAE
jgi:hypothetical protein